MKKKTFRNNDIYTRKHRDKKSYKEIALEFCISETRVRQILFQVYTNKRYSEIPRVLEIDKACEYYKVDKTTRGRIYNALSSHGYLKRNRWTKLTQEEIMSIPNLGVLTTKIIQKAQELV